VRRIALVTSIIAAASLPGCPEDGHDAGAGDAPVVDAAAASPLVPRCRVTIEALPVEMASEAPIALAGGPHGVTVFTADHLWDGVDVAPFHVADGASVASTSSGHLLAEGRTLSLVQYSPLRRRVVRQLGRSTADAEVLETTVGPVLLYRRVPAPSDARNAPESSGGSVEIERLDDNGRSLGPPVSLGDHDPALADVTWFATRWDTGRIVLEVENDDGRKHYAVLSPDGRERSSGEGHGVACLLAGCVRLIGRTDPRAAEFGAHIDGMVHAEILSHGTALSLPLAGDHVDAVAVRGDRLLAIVRNGAEGSVTRMAALVDVTRRRPVPVTLSAAQEVAVSWMLPPMNLTPIVHIVENGFVILHDDASARLVLERIECD